MCSVRCLNHGYMHSVSVGDKCLPQRLSQPQYAPHPWQREVGRLAPPSQTGDTHLPQPPSWLPMMVSCRHPPPSLPSSFFLQPCFWKAASPCCPGPGPSPCTSTAPSVAPRCGNQPLPGTFLTSLVGEGPEYDGRALTQGHGHLGSFSAWMGHWVTRGPRHTASFLRASISPAAAAATEFRQALSFAHPAPYLGILRPLS